MEVCRCVHKQFRKGLVVGYNCKISTISFAIGSFQIELLAFLYHTRVEFIFCVFSPVLAVLLVPPVHPVPRGKDIKCLYSSSTIPKQTVSLLKKGDLACEELNRDW